MAGYACFIFVFLIFFSSFLTHKFKSYSKMLLKHANVLLFWHLTGCKQIRSMEHKIQHETLPLKEEKQFIRDIKQLKQIREQFSSNMGSQDEVQQAMDQKDQSEERLKVLSAVTVICLARVISARCSTS